MPTISKLNPYLEQAISGASKAKDVMAPFVSQAAREAAKASEKMTPYVATAKEAVSPFVNSLVEKAKDKLGA